MRLTSQSPSDVRLSTAQAARQFIDHMTARIDDPFNDFVKRLKLTLEDSQLGLDERFAFFERKDLSAIFLAHTVAMEASLVRTVFDVTTADAVLAELADQLDELEFADGSQLGEPLSSVFWDVLARVQICTIDETKKPHDIALKHMLGVLDLRRRETRGVLKDFVVRQSLSECLARCTQFWWISLSQKAELSIAEPEPGQRAASTRPTDLGLPGITRLDP